MTTTAVLVEVLAGKLEMPSSEIPESATFEELAADSLTLLEMSLALEKRLKVKIDEGTLQPEHRIAEAAEILESLPRLA
ncbi:MULTISPECIES: acyl carrier protein [unclassified Micromonospora]|uniref:acyl carrier protein n=1 Tax=Micromonospora TaxID=1873 RepID=UPI00249A4830|nr:MULTISPECIES: acyl carrier protein [unclassified Micromonospora]WFE64312.1 acyl carrier protein [Micromonospora sp. WMMD714]WFE96728.1 acyl carrier protein [Micromonospora sp. WMMD987]